MLHRHLTDAPQVSESRTVERFVRLTTAHTVQELNLIRLASDIGITQQTARRWLSGHEIDVLIDTGERVVPPEVKSGQTVAADALIWRGSIPSNPNRGGILVHGGAESFVFKGCRVLPWFLR